MVKPMWGGNDFSIESANSESEFKSGESAVTALYQQNISVQVYSVW